MITTKEQLKELLSEYILIVEFNKADGSKRTMKCTLMENMVKPHVKKTERPKKPNDDVLSVWDVEKDAFRSFRLDSLISYQKIEEGYEL
jgi:hypothetical protein